MNKKDLTNLQTYLPEPFRSMSIQEMRKVQCKFRDHRLRAKKRGIDFFFEFDEWCCFWGDNWYQRGLGSNALCMARYNDEGPYIASNVRIITHAENLKEGNNVGIKKSISQKKAYSTNPSYKSNLSASMSKINAKRAHKYMIDGNVMTIREAMQYLQKSKRTIGRWLKKFPEKYYRIE